MNHSVEGRIQPPLDGYLPEEGDKRRNKSSGSPQSLTRKRGGLEHRNPSNLYWAEGARTLTEAFQKAKKDDNVVILRKRKA